MAAGRKVWQREGALEASAHLQGGRLPARARPRGAHACRMPEDKLGRLGASTRGIFSLGAVPGCCPQLCGRHPALMTRGGRRLSGRPRGTPHRPMSSRLRTSGAIGQPAHPARPRRCAQGVGRHTAERVARPLPKPRHTERHSKSSIPHCCCTILVPLLRSLVISASRSVFPHNTSDTSTCADHLDLSRKAIKL